ncbi:gamma-glutamyltranspeptidase / glutathione hydrolase [Haloechinothrix alba]|uniref:Gamma-glutamyltranspeptidase / glutathione hydrolase n=1 Tax=Haloechinothrix alba TaxID=664784 RepID=A0A239A2U4_9PSEU|nr:gamma-glutamyltransferase [Haloechinothrix alba]SNR89631.1 gamma-glutamyltranspeptidase / glutathione hydrolase [Haloechinothrix alba]
MFTTRPELLGTTGMVASTHWLGSATGMAVLEAGGNAFDAAVATGFVLQVAEPHLNGPAGQVPALLATADDPRPAVLCGQGVAPAAATPGRFAELGLRLIPGSGLLPATVPGAWDAWLLLLRDHGTLRLRDVLGYAIGYAERGVVVLDRMTETIRTVADLFRTHWPSSAELWLPDGRPPEPGSLHRNPALARTWQRLLAEAERFTGREAQIDAARRAWSHGFVAEAVDRFTHQAFRDDSGRAHPGLLSGDDMALWSAGYEDPLVTELGDWSLVKCGAWTQGPVLAQQLLMLDGFADQLSYVDGVPTARTVHLAVECAKLAFADREAWLGDTPEAAATVPDLLSADYLRQRRELVADAAADLRPGSPGGRQALLPGVLAETRGLAGGVGPTGEPTVRTSGVTGGDTVHLDVVDSRGNMISATPSGGWLQSSPTIGELGFCLDTRAQMFWLEDGLPNTLAPGKRPRITLSPSMALRGGQPRLAFGTPGGDQQDQWQLCFWLAHVLGGLNLQEAIDAPAWHTTAVPSSFVPRGWTPRGLEVESRLGTSTIDALREYGHEVTDAGPWALGRLSAVAREPSGILRGAANPRGMQGYAAGR